MERHQCRVFCVLPILNPYNVMTRSAYLWTSQTVFCWLLSVWFPADALWCLYSAFTEGWIFFCLLSAHRVLKLGFGIDFTLYCAVLFPFIFPPLYLTQYITWLNLLWTGGVPLQIISKVMIQFAQFKAVCALSSLFVCVCVCSLAEDAGALWNTTVLKRRRMDTQSDWSVLMFSLV